MKSNTTSLCLNELSSDKSVRETIGGRGWLGGCVLVLTSTVKN